MTFSTKGVKKQEIDRAEKEMKKLTVKDINIKARKSL